MRVWTVLISAAILLFALVGPAQADTPVVHPAVTAAPVGMEPPSFNGVCSSRIPFTATIAITADGPGIVNYFWGGNWPYNGVLVFDEAGTKTARLPFWVETGYGPQNLVVTVVGSNKTTVAVPYQLGCVDPVPGKPRLQPATDYVGRCGADVVHAISAEITSPIAQTVRYRWLDVGEQPLPGLDDSVREIVFSEPGTKTVSGPLQRVAFEGIFGTYVELQIVSPGSATSTEPLYFRTTCVRPEFTALTRTSGNCKTGAAYRFRLDGYVEASAVGETAYAWARQESPDADWVREPWTPMSFNASNSPGRQSVSKIWTAEGDGLGSWRLEVLGTDGTVVSQSLPYYVPCGL